jgi:hypothetical protein
MPFGMATTTSYDTLCDLRKNLAPAVPDTGPYLKQLGSWVNMMEAQLCHFSLSALIADFTH